MTIYTLQKSHLYSGSSEVLVLLYKSEEICKQPIGKHTEKIATPDILKCLASDITHIFGTSVLKYFANYLKNYSLQSKNTSYLSLHSLQCIYLTTNSFNNIFLKSFKFIRFCKCFSIQFYTCSLHFSNYVVFKV